MQATMARLGRGGRRILGSRMLPWMLAGLFLVAAAGFGVLWWRERGEDARVARVQATAAAFLVALTNFQAETIERDVEEIRSFAIGAFADEVEETFSPDRIEAIRESMAVSTGEVRRLFVQDLGEDSATVFAVVDEVVSNAASPAPREDVLRIEVELIETEGGWKVGRVQILQSPAGGLVP